ncbi:MAG TPA: type IV pilus assembly protein PilM [Solirubrobacterales bacterium]|nr:type IV pilus assembly protein PilM [Solirubrobacterales bacterium]
MLQLTRKKKTAEAGVGIDIEAGSIAATEIRSNGSVTVNAAAIEPLPAGAFNEGEVTDPDRLVEGLKSLFSTHKLSKDVRVGIANQRVVVRTVRLPAIEDPEQMATAARFQAQEQIPMPLDQAVLEHQVVGGVPAEEGSTPLVDVVVVAARREMVSSFLEPVRRAGLNPVGVDLSAFGMIRALAGVAAEAEVAQAAADGQSEAETAVLRPEGAVLYCNLSDVMNLAVARGRACLFTRVSNEGLEGIVGRLAAERGLSPEHATQWLSHVGLEQPLETVDGDPETLADARRVLEEGVTGLVDELRLSLDYYGAQESAVPVGRIVLCGPGSAVPGMAARMEEGLGLPIAVSRPPALAEYGEDAAARLTLPYGLALEH